MQTLCNWLVYFVEKKWLIKLPENHQQKFTGKSPEKVSLSGVFQEISSKINTRKSPQKVSLSSLSQVYPPRWLSDN